MIDVPAASRDRVLIVEDDPARCKVFRTMFSGVRRLDVVATYAGAVAAMSGRTRYSLILLDHDIASPDRNGQDVALWMVKNLAASKNATRVVIHSANARGALGIHQTLRPGGFKDVTFAPFPSRVA